MLVRIIPRQLFRCAIPAFFIINSNNQSILNDFPKAQETKLISENSGGYSEEIDKRIKMYTTTTEDKWNKIHSTETQYTIFTIADEEIVRYSYFLYLSRFLLGTSAFVAGSTVLGYGLVAVNLYLGYTTCGISLLATAAAYKFLDIMRGKVVIKVVYDTKKKMFCFTTILKARDLKETWVYPQDIGVNLNPRVDQNWIYYNKVTKDIYPTIGNGTWINEELFLYVLLKANNYLPKTKKGIEGNVKNELLESKSRPVEAIQPINKELIK